MTSSRSSVRVGIEFAIVLACGANALAFTSTQTVNFSETTIASGITVDMTTLNYPVSATFQQLDPAVGTLNRVTFEYHFDFECIGTIPDNGGGDFGASVGGTFFVNGDGFGGDGNGNGTGGGPGVHSVEIVMPFNGLPGSLTLDAMNSPSVFAQFQGAGTVELQWPLSVTINCHFSGPPGLATSVDLRMKDTSYMKVTYDYCGAPFADADGDRDVDIADFGVWQSCFDDPQGPANSAVCACLDNNHNGMVDADDFAQFVKCWSGPAVQADPTCTGL